MTIRGATYEACQAAEQMVRAREAARMNGGGFGDGSATADHATLGGSVYMAHCAYHYLDTGPAIEPANQKMQLSH